MEAAAVAADSRAKARRRANLEGKPSRLPATFESKQIIALVTKLCLASRAAHFARALPAAVCTPGVAAVEGALLETYATRGGKRAQKTPNRERNKRIPTSPIVAVPWSCELRESGKIFRKLPHLYR